MGTFAGEELGEVEMNRMEDVALLVLAAFAVLSNLIALILNLIGD